MIAPLDRGALRALIGLLQQAQGTIVPVLNDEYLPAAWVRDVADQLAAALGGADAAGKEEKAEEETNGEDADARVDSQ